MKSTNHPPEAAQRADPHFATTRWSLVLSAGQGEDPASQQALAQLCEAYWYPLYAYIRRRTSDIHEARDLTQAFFQTLLEKRLFETADPHRGRFRAFLLTACKRFLVNEWHKDRAQKRGGGLSPLSLDFDLGESRYTVEAIETASPERLYEQQWAITLLGRVLEKLRAEYQSKGKLSHFEHLKAFLSGSPRSDALSAAADALQISPEAVQVAAHRLRKRYRELLRAEIAATVESSDEVEDEIRNLFSILGS